MATAILAGIVAGATACGTPTAAPTANPSVTATLGNIPFEPCTEQNCAGALDGNPFQIDMPSRWNGGLLLYSPPARPGYAVQGEAPVAQASVVPRNAPDTDRVRDSLLRAGFALAGTSTAASGWRIDEQLQATERLRQHFVDRIATPWRTFVWGEAEGAVASLQLAESADWVNGAVALCGVQAGFNPNYDLALDAAASVRALLYPRFKISNYSSVEEARGEYRRAMRRVRLAAEDRFGEGAQKLFVIATAAVVPSKSRNSSGSSPSSAAQPISENLAHILRRSTIDRFEAEQQLGGNPSTNVGTDYAARVTAQSQERLEAFQPGAMRRWINRIQRSDRVPADSEARSRAASLTNVTGEVRVPTFAVAGAYDELAIVQNQGSYVAKSLTFGPDVSRFLEVAVTVPPVSYPEDGGVSTGAGHCNFTDETIAGSVVILNDWVRFSVFPSKQSISDLLGTGSGYAPEFALRQWPPGLPEDDATADD